MPLFQNSSEDIKLSVIDFIQQSFKEGFQAMRVNFLPACFLWTFGGIILLAYYFTPQSRFIFDAIESTKSDWGIIYMFLSTGFFGAILPGLFSIFLLKDKNSNLSSIFILFLFWGIKGIEVEYFYLFQAFAFGDSVMLKTLFDQLIYVPIWGLTSVVLFYHFYGCKFNPKVFCHTLGKHWYRDRVIKVLLPNWSVWTPAIMLIYLLPQPLQLPLQNLTLAFWVMVLAYLSFHNPYKND